MRKEGKKNEKIITRLFFSDTFEVCNVLKGGKYSCVRTKNDYEKVAEKRIKNERENNKNKKGA